MSGNDQDLQLHHELHLLGYELTACFDRPESLCKVSAACNDSLPWFRCHSAVAVKVPDGVNPAEVAPLMCAGITVWSPISQKVTKPGMKVPFWPHCTLLSVICCKRCCEPAQLLGPCREASF